MDYHKINEVISDFVQERNWEKFHTPKNLSMALSVEASELVEIFQWQDEKSFIDNKKEIIEKSKEEIADIFYYLVRVCQVLNLDLEEAFFEKIERNKNKYPVEKFKGLSTWKVK